MVLCVRKFVSVNISSIELLELLCDMCNEARAISVGCHLILQSSNGYNARLFETRIQALPVDNLKYTFKRWECDFLERNNKRAGISNLEYYRGRDSFCYKFQGIQIPSALVASFEKDDVPSVWYSTIWHCYSDGMKNYTRRIFNAFYGDLGTIIRHRTRERIKLELNIFASKVINPDAKGLQNLLMLEEAYIVTFSYSNKYGWVSPGSDTGKTVTVAISEEIENIIQNSKQSLMRKLKSKDSCEYLLMKIGQSQEILEEIDFALANLNILDKVASDGSDTAFFNAVKYLDGLAGVKGTRRRVCKELRYYIGWIW